VVIMVSLRDWKKSEMRECAAARMAAGKTNVESADTTD